MAKDVVCGMEVDEKQAFEIKYKGKRQNEDVKEG